MSDDNKFVLYKKTHTKTGIKYLGMTSRDPFEYQGSGIYWKRLLKSHGKEHLTEILCECASLEEVSRVGQYYSDLWNIVESHDWANLKPETGEGAPSGKYHHYSSEREDYDKTKHPGYGKKQSEISKEKNRQSNSGKNSSMYGSIWVNNGFVNKKIKKNEQIPENWNLGRLINHQKKFGKRDKSESKNPNYDSTLRCFIHNSGLIEHCTQRQLINKYSLRESSVSSLVRGKLKSTGGWKIL